MITHEHALKNGTVLNNYIIVKVLGAGGFGITYLAKDIQLGLEVVIKEYFPNEFAIRKVGDTITSKSSYTSKDFAKGKQRFKEEAQILAKFNHPSIVKILGYFEANDTAYFVMEYEEGLDLSQHIRQKGTPLSQEEILSIMMPILEGLKEVHRYNYLHRDIKPGNVLLRANKPPVLIDFGASKLALGEASKSITSMLTEGYAPLEQYSTDVKQQGSFTDLYAVAAVIYKMITGKVPPSAQTRSYQLLQDDNDPFEPLTELNLSEYDKNFLKAVDRALSMKAKDRPQNVQEFQSDIAGELNHEEFNTKKSSDISNSIGKYISIFALLLLIILGGYFYVQQSNDESSILIVKSVIETDKNTSREELIKTKRELEELKRSNKEEAMQRRMEKKHIEQEEAKRQAEERKKEIVKIVSGQIFYIQVGSFSKAPDSRFLGTIKKNGFSYKLDYGKLLLGPYEDRTSAEEALIKAKSKINKSAFIKTESKSKINKSVFIIPGKSVVTKTDLKKTIVMIINGFKNKNEIVLNKLIHSKYGFSVIYLVGSQGIRSETSSKIDFSIPMPSHFPYDYRFKIKNDVQFNAIEVKRSPKFDFGTGKWSGLGLYYTYAGNDDFLTNLIARSKLDYISGLGLEFIDKLLFFQNKSYRVVYFDLDENELVFYVTFIDNKWYLTLIDRYSSDI